MTIVPTPPLPICLAGCFSRTQLCSGVHTLGQGGRGDRYVSREDSTPATSPHPVPL